MTSLHTLPRPLEASRAAVTGVLHYVADELSDAAVSAVRPFLWGGALELATVFPQHDSFAYITAGSLDAAYLATARAALADPHVYVVLSDTRSPMNRLLSHLTHDPYNHASLAFDRDLATLVSCSGGNLDESPGLHPESPDGLLARPGAAYVTLSVAVTEAQKAYMIDRVEAIDREGTSFNLLGLVTKRAAKPNIMFCSQFTYRILEEAGAAWFEADPCHVRPGDFLRHEADHVTLGARVTGPPLSS
ncbi:MAG: hypothetical protein LBR33_09705 [Propionibacteriaceae bacterium]|jgi:hypothetical protein|nr:hypothetical protein [Propionibacteriaceae bacterium]